MAKSTTRYSNNARTTLSASILDTSTTLPVVSSAGFPPLSSGTDHFFVTLEGGQGIEIVKVRGISGNTFINCERGQEGTVAKNYPAATAVENRLTAGNISGLARLVDRLNDVSSIEVLDRPSDSDGNSFVSAATDVVGAPIVGVVNGTKWRLINYPDVIRVGTVAAGATATSIPLSGAASFLIETSPKIYVIQFTSGDNLGRLRFITTVATNSISWTTALGSTPVAGDSYEIYRCISGWKAPMGNNSDRIFFENDATVWSSYSIPVGRNASSTGPVTIASGATVTVPSGSAWSIL